MDIMRIPRRASRYARLLLYAEPGYLDVILLSIGVLASIASGVPFPLLGILFGQLMDDINFASCDNADGVTTPSYQADVNAKVLTVVYIGIANLVLIYVYMVCWNLFAERLAQRLREKYLRSLLYKDIQFFDKLTPGEVSSHLSADIATIQAGTSEKVGIVLNAVSFFVSAYTIAFIKDAKLGGMLVSLTPAFLLMSLVGGHYIGKHSGVMSSQISSASSLALEALSNIITVHALGANIRLETRFADILRKAKSAGICKAVTVSVQSGLLYFIAYSSSALAYWQGSKSIAAAVDGNSGGTTVGTIYTVIFILVDATIILSTVAPFLQIFGAAQSVFDKLEVNMTRHSDLLIQQTGSSSTSDCLPSLALEHVSFAYPSRPLAKVLSDVSITFSAGKTTAIVGLSGCGKSTITALLLRFYDPVQGRITIGDLDLKAIDLRSLRSQISIVEQDSTLFERSILENIALGLVSSHRHAHLLDTLQGPSLSQLSTKLRNGFDLASAAHDLNGQLQEIVGLVIRAALAADADQFIRGLKYGYGTQVGSKGTLLSGGQKQRIAIARALVKDPNVLILDEATASLDSASERRIQAALNHASKERTTIIIAHRLSTVKGADRIVVMGAGHVLEDGSHDELIAAKGAYYELNFLQIETMDTGSEVSEKEMSATSSQVHLEAKQESCIAERRSSTHEKKINVSKSSMASLKDPDIDIRNSMGQVFKKLQPLFRPYLALVLVAFIAVIVVGSTYSAAAVIFGNTVGALSPCRPASSIMAAGKFFALMFFVLAVIEFFANTISWSGFGIIAEKILYKVRLSSFKSLLRQDLYWHESADRSPNKLLALITSDGNSLGALTGSTIGTIFSILINLLAAIILTHILAWKLALVCLATVPLILGAGTIQLIVLARFASRHKEAFTTSIGLAVEAVGSMRTVTAMSLQEEVLHAYIRSLEQPTKDVKLRILHANMWLALAYGLPTFIYAMAYWWGTKLVIAGEYNQVEFFIVVVALLVSAQLWGQLFTVAPDVTKAFAAVNRIINILSIGSSVSPQKVDELADVEEKENVVGTSGSSVSFIGVDFCYPARPDVRVLKAISLEVQPGQFVAFVGQSGAGKSTVLALIERLYRPSSGLIMIDGNDIGSSSISFRNSIAFVPQESVLFEGTIHFNVALGALPSHTATNEEIEEACRIAGIHDTISSLPDGYETECGTGGTQLSGGQKQRIAVARALVRRPRLLLLDEGTSALDAETEKNLADALNSIRKKTSMTVIAIAHRLSTIKNADLIFLLEDGKVTSQGTHAELLQFSDSYCRNAKQQGLLRL